MEKTQRNIYDFYRRGKMLLREWDIRLLQNDEEMKVVLAIMDSLYPAPVCVVEIGVKHGGWLFTVCNSLGTPYALGIDRKKYDTWERTMSLCRTVLPTGSFMQLWKNDSQEKNTVDLVSRYLQNNCRYIDILHIDGDHSFEGCKHDFISYTSFVRPGGLVIFHDIVSDYGCSKFYKDIKKHYVSVDIVTGKKEKHGTGILRVPGDRDKLIETAKGCKM